MFSHKLIESSKSANLCLLVYCIDLGASCCTILKTSTYINWNDKDVGKHGSSEDIVKKGVSRGPGPPFFDNVYMFYYAYVIRVILQRCDCPWDK